MSDERIAAVRVRAEIEHSTGGTYGPDWTLGFWEFDELVAHVSWNIVQGLMYGKPLRSLVHEALYLTLTWQDERARAEQKEKEKR